MRSTVPRLVLDAAALAVLPTYWLPVLPLLVVALDAFSVPSSARSRSLARRSMRSTVPLLVFEAAALAVRDLCSLGSPVVALLVHLLDAFQVVAQLVQLPVNGF